MDSLKLHLVFHVFLWLPVALAVVEPPTNVTLQCHNMRNILQWSYQQPTPGLRFRVVIQPYSGEAVDMWVDPPALQADVSNFSDPKNEYLLSVTAVVGQNKSEPAPTDGITFSYFKDSYTSQTCSLDLPPVNVTALPDDIIAFSFTHPWLLYQPVNPNSENSRPRSKRRYQSEKALPEFKYGVVLVNQKQPHHFSCVKSVCGQEIPVEPTQEKRCLNISGEMQKMAVKSTQLYCAIASPAIPLQQYNYIIYIVVSLLIASVVALILVLVYKKKTSPGSDVPNSMKIKTKPQNATATVEEEICVTAVEPSSPTPLLSDHDNTDLTPTYAPSTEPDDLHLTLRPLANDEGLYEEDEGQGYRGGGHMEDMEDMETESCSEAPTGYEKREVVVKLGPNDLAEGYRA